MIAKKPYVLESITKATPEVNVFRFKAQEGSKLDFEPGMFAMLYYKDPETGEEIGRAYSIANAPDADYLEFTIAMVHGKLTSVLESAKVGDVYYISAPYGEFKFDIESCEKFLMLAGGTGIVPFFSFIRHVREKCPGLDLAMIYSVRYPQSIIGKDELYSLFANDPKKKLVVTVTRPQPGDGWTGQTGHIDSDMIKKCVPDFLKRTVYICGPPKFAETLKQCMSGLGCEEQKIKVEIWGE